MQMIDRKPAPADRQQLQREGYLLVSGLVNTAGVEQLLRWTTELAAARRSAGATGSIGRTVSPRRTTGSCNGWRTSVPFTKPSTGSCVRVRCRHGPQRCWADPRCCSRTRSISRCPGGAGFKLHQDQQAGWSRYAPLFVTAMISLDAAPVASGCLEIAAGRHREGLIGSEWHPLDESGIDLTVVPTAPGDAIFFDSYVPHASRANLSDSPRRILYLTYNLARDGDHRARYFTDKYAAFPPDIDRDPAKSYVFRV